LVERLAQHRAPQLSVADIAQAAVGTRSAAGENNEQASVLEAAERATAYAADIEEVP